MSDAFWRDGWIGNKAGEPCMLVRHLIKGRERNVTLHKFVKADDPDFFHSHPARAIRVILCGAYTEELRDGTLKRWRPGMIGLVRPDFWHRIAEVEGVCITLWLRGKKTNDVEISDQPIDHAILHLTEDD